MHPLFGLVQRSLRVAQLAQACGEPLDEATDRALALDLGHGAAEDQARTMVADLDRMFPGSHAAHDGMKAVRFQRPSCPWTLGSYAGYLPGQWTSIRGACTATDRRVARADRDLHVSEIQSEVSRPHFHFHASVGTSSGGCNDCTYVTSFHTASVLAMPPYAGIPCGRPYQIDWKISPSAPP